MSRRSPGSSARTGACWSRRHSSRSSMRARVPCAAAPISCSRTRLTDDRSSSSGCSRTRRRSMARASRLDGLVAGAARFQDRVREDLQHGVARALGGPWILNRRRGPSSRSGSGVRRSADGRLPDSLSALRRIAPTVPRDQPIYSSAYAVTTLCRTALPGRPAPAGLWESLAAVTRLSRIGCRTDDLIVRPFNGRLFARSAAPTLERAGAVASWHARRRRCAIRRSGRRSSRSARGRAAAAGKRSAYSGLDVEQLGAVYERVLDLDPADVVRARGARRFRSAGGTPGDNERNTEVARTGPATKTDGDLLHAAIAHGVRRATNARAARPRRLRRRDSCAARRRSGDGQRRLSRRGVPLPGRRVRARARRRRALHRAGSRRRRARRHPPPDRRAMPGGRRRQSGRRATRSPVACG